MKQVKRKNLYSFVSPPKKHAIDSYVDDEDKEIARLERLLGISSKEKSKGAAKLNKEYAKYEVSMLQ
jgi:hypothetical protein